MAMGRDGEVQGDLMVTWEEMRRSPGHVFYDRLQKLLAEAGFDVFVEETCKPYYAPKMGAPSVPPGRYYRMHMIGYFEGLDSERALSGAARTHGRWGTSFGLAGATRFLIIRGYRGRAVVCRMKCMKRYSRSS